VGVVDGKTLEWSTSQRRGRKYCHKAFIYAGLRTFPIIRATDGFCTPQKGGHLQVKQGEIRVKCAKFPN
jgi:hypothetical protein